MKLHIIFPAALMCSLFIAARANSQDVAYKYELGKPYKYLLEFNSDVIQEMGGQTMNATVEGTAAVVLTHDKRTDDGNLHLQLLFENALVIAESPQGMQTFGESLKGNSIGLTIDPTGKPLDQDSITFKPEAQDMQVVSELFSMFPILDPTKLSVGGSWERARTDTIGEGDNTMLRKRNFHFEVKEAKMVKERNCLAINAKRITETTGKMSRGGMELRVSGEEKSEGVIHFDPAAGIIIDMILNETGEQIIQDTGGSSMKVNITSRGKTTMEYLPD